MSDRSILNHEQLSTLLILTTCFRVEVRRLTLAQPDAPVRTFYLAIIGAGAPVSLIALTLRLN
jgi:hypothetical protein